VRWLKNGSFDFAEGLAYVSGQKQMCHLWAGNKIVF